MGDIVADIRSGKRLLFDGAMGTELQQRGLVPGLSPEVFCLSHPDILESVHRDYCLAGADVLTTNTFGGTKCKLPAGIDVFDFNRKMAEAACNAASQSGRRVYVAGSIGPTGTFLQPLGDVSFDVLTGYFQEQVRGLVAGGVDLFIIETQFDVAEARAAVIAIRRETRLPVAVSMTYEHGVTLTGSSVAVCAATFANMGVDLLGMNCSAGPVEMREAVEQLLAASPVPALVQPNAGLPVLENGTTVFPLQPSEFAELTAAFAAQGVQAVGGCCGTSPAHIAALRKILDTLPPAATPQEKSCISLTSRGAVVHIGYGFPFCLIGERINPTGKKQLTAELQAGELGLALRYADEQIAAGAQVLDVNVGAPQADETTLLPSLVSRLFTAHTAPLVLDSSNPAAIEAALPVYPASPLVNSISGEPGRMEILGPLCRDYGAPFILLPLQGSALPVLAVERIAIVEKLLERMDGLGIPRRLALVDILALSVSSSPEAAKECLAFASHCRDVLHLPTTCGLSNISFGLPARDILNSHFLSLAAGAGLCSCIANPSNVRLAEAVDALHLFQGHDAGAEHFIKEYAGWQQSSSQTGGVVPDRRGSSAKNGSAHNGVVTLEDAVILGKKDIIAGLVEAALAEGEEPFDIVGRRLIPAITEVGEKYGRKEYFLPQLIRSAEAMQAAFAVIRPLLEKDSRSADKPAIVIATVEGDIHDIGKNIVGLLLGNHGFEVVDLGKDVKADRIVEAALEHNAYLIGLSALMTTTMVKMQETVDLLKERGLDKKVLVGGAVLTEDFAKSIGAHYAGDAVDSVRLAKELLALK